MARKNLCGDCRRRAEEARGLRGAVSLPVSGPAAAATARAGRKGPEDARGGAFGVGPPLAAKAPGR